MHCFVYKGTKQADHYLFLNQEFDQQNPPVTVPQALLDLLGELNLVVEFQLDPMRKMPQADAQQVYHNLQQHGFYLQMPSKDMAAVETEFFN